MEAKQFVTQISASMARQGMDASRVPNFVAVRDAADQMTASCHGASLLAGWWTGPDGVDIRNNPLTFSNKLMLSVSELSESMEGDRKSLPDDKLPQFPMRLVEIADSIIRNFDLAGAYIPEGSEYTFGDILAAKMAFNAVRPDHKKEAREAEGGKTY